MVWEVQHDTLADGWVNTWTEEDETGAWVPLVYATQDAAEAELSEFLREIALEIEYGERDPDAGYDQSEFRIVEVAGDTEADMIAGEKEEA